jgi:hypothetical protein
MHAEDMLSKELGVSYGHTDGRNWGEFSLLRQTFEAEANIVRLPQLRSSYLQSMLKLVP